MSHVPMKNSAGRDVASPRWRPGILIPCLILAAIAVRVAGLGFRSIDIQDFLLDWYNSLALDGFGALREPFSNYTPPYLYLLFLATRTDGVIPRIVAIKLIPVFFDLVNASLVYKILRIRYPDGIQAWLGAAVFLVLPTVVLNSAYWGQADALYSCFLLACLLFLLKNQALPAMIFLGIAFAFKAQAVFLGPFILLLVVKRRIPLTYLGVIPLVYLLMMSPAALTGRSLSDLLSTYVSQASVYRRLSEHAPNLYLFVSDSFYTPGVTVGIGLTTLVVVIWIVLYARKIKEFTPPTLLFCALASVVMMPFFLPKMHDRYFYPAEVLAFLAAFYVPRVWWLALGYQFVSGLVYFVVLRASVLPLEPALAGSLLILAALVNLGLTIYVFWVQWHVTNGSDLDMFSIYRKTGMQAPG